MGKAIITNKLEAGDIDKLRQLHFKTNPAGTMPEFGGLNQETMVMRDENDPTRIVGYIHFERPLEMREMITDPDYELRTQALSHAFAALETRIRCGDLGTVDRYYATVPLDHKHVQRFYESDGAVRVDNNTIRFVKKV